jgi:hypothetical protein
MSKVRELKDPSQKAWMKVLLIAQAKALHTIYKVSFNCVI